MTDNRNQDLPTGRIFFDVEEVDNGNNFDIYDGKFVAPIDGTYYFLFNGHITGYDFTGLGDSMSVHGRINVIVNGDVINRFYDGEDAQYARNPTFYVSLQLKVKDELWLENKYSPSFITKPDLRMTFSGYLIN